MCPRGQHDPARRVRRTTGTEKASPALTAFQDVHYYDENVNVPVGGRQVQATFEAIASLHDWPISDLLGNVAVPARTPLPCRIITRLPAGCTSMDGHSGYIHVKFKESATVRGHGFTGDIDRSPDYVPPPTKKRKEHRPREPISPKRTRMNYHTSDTSPDSPESAVGKTQPTPVRLHRAAALAVSQDPEADSAMWILHVCGRKNCAVVAHYRPGTPGENEDDENYHKRRRGSSLRSYTPWQ